MKLSPEDVVWLRRMLSNIGFLSALSADEFDTMTAMMQKESFNESTTIVKQGDIGDCFFIIFEGTVSVWSAGKDGKKKEVAKLRAGSYFGEIALIWDEPRDSTIIADTDVMLFLLLKENFKGLLKSNMKLEQKLQEIMTQRQTERKQQIIQNKDDKGGFFKKFF